MSNCKWSHISLGERTMNWMRVKAFSRSSCRGSVAQGLSVCIRGSCSTHHNCRTTIVLQFVAMQHCTMRGILFRASHQLWSRNCVSCKLHVTWHDLQML